MNYFITETKKYFHSTRLPCVFVCAFFGNGTSWFLHVRRLRGLSFNWNGQNINLVQKSKLYFVLFSSAKRNVKNLFTTFWGNKYESFMSTTQNLLLWNVCAFFFLRSAAPLERWMNACDSRHSPVSAVVVVFRTQRIFFVFQFDQISNLIKDKMKRKDCAWLHAFSFGE